jgi:hypothetical protein
MADADHQDSSGTNSDLDLKSFYRAPGDAEAQSTPRRTLGLDIRNFFRPPSEQQDTGRTTARLDINDYLRPPGTELPDLGPLKEDADPHPPAAAAPQSQLSTTAVSDHPSASGEMPMENASEALAEAPPQPPPAPPAKPSENPLYRFAAIGAMGGVLFGVAIIIVSWAIGGTPGAYDLGQLTSSEAGLKGHLYTKWEGNKLQYRLAIEPSGSEQQAGFALVVGNPPRPLAVNFVLKDPKGFSLCSREVLLKYTPGAAPATAPTAPTSDATAAEAGNPGSVAPGQQADLAQLQAQETQRETGKDLFQEQTGPGGRIDAINAQGVVPCSKDSYEQISMWSFSPDFPTLAEQNELLKREAEAREAAAHPAPRKKPVAKPTPKPLLFAIEGDDVLVGYDSAGGYLESGNGQVFYVDKQANLAAWQIFPARIHYRCDQASGCTIIRAGSGAVLRARLKK